MIMSLHDKPEPFECSKAFAKIYQFKIALRETKPLVWRRIQVPGCYSFWDLHCAITDCFGWLDYHLHLFTLLNPKTGEKDHIGVPGEDDDLLGYEVLPGRRKKISRCFTMENTDADYRYDFGDSWRHSVILEAILTREKGLAYPRCIAGENACPPEDCGGVSEYEHFKTAISCPNAEDHDELLEWVGGWFDPEWFDLSLIRFDDPELRWDIAFEEKPVPQGMRQEQYHRMRTP
jgi:hypothetical protein